MQDDGVCEILFVRLQSEELVLRECMRVSCVVLQLAIVKRQIFDRRELKWIAYKNNLDTTKDFRVAFYATVM